MTTETVFKARMTGPELKALWEKAKDDYARLRACPRHRFLPVFSEQPKKYRCETCDGEANTEYVMAYCAGFRAAGGDPREVCSSINGEAA
jgi:hypothetical protein